MQKLKIALCDKDEFYRRRFSEYVVKHKAKEMDLSVYSDREQFEEALGREKFDLVLAAEEFASEEMEKVLFLCDDYGGKAAEPAMWEGEISPVRKRISRYQPMEQVMHELYIMVGQDGDRKHAQAGSGRLQVIGICSPGRHEMQSLFSVLYAINMAENGRVLYLSFLEFLGFKELFEFTGECDMGDIMLKVRGDCLTRESFWSCVYEMHGASVILPFENPENFHQTGREEFYQLLEFVEKFTDFELVVVDFGLSMEDAALCMKRCNVLYLLGKEEFFYQCQEQAFSEWMKKSGNEDVVNKIQKIYLPYTAKNLRGGGAVIEQLQWSEFGDFVRGYMKNPGCLERGEEIESDGRTDTVS